MCFNFFEAFSAIYGRLAFLDSLNTIKVDIVVVSASINIFEKSLFVVSCHSQFYNLLK
jgi:hypothetical protein